MGCVEGAGGVFLDGEMHGLDAGGGGVGASYGDGEELGATEAGLYVGGGGREDGFVGDGYFDGFGVVGVELWVG